MMNTAHIEWTGEGMDFKGTLGSGYTFELGSGGEGGSPMEFLLAGVAGCTAVDVVHILRKQRQPFTGVTVEISGERAPDHPKVYTSVNLTYVVQGENIDPKAVEKAIALSKEKYCSASMMFQRSGTAVHTSYRIEPA